MEEQKASSDIQVVELRDSFYRDSIGKIIFVIASLLLGLALLIALSIYIYLDKPPPVTFPVGDEWRVQPPVQLNEPYLTVPEVLQWVSDVLQKSFVYDFRNYNNQVKAASQYFTPDGWKTFLNQLNIYVNYNTVQANKVFVQGTPAAVLLVNRGENSAGVYTWIIQMPIKLTFSGYKPLPSKTLPLEVRVVRVPTANNLMGVAIDNVVLSTTAKGIE